MSLFNHLLCGLLVITVSGCGALGAVDEAAAPLDAFTLGALGEDNDLVGTVSFERETRVKLRHKGLIYRMYVRSDAAGRGIGRQLIQAAVARASQIHGLEQLNLTVVATNARAKHLYASEGFVSFALEQRGLKMGAHYVNEEQMVLRLRK